MALKAKYIFSGEIEVLTGLHIGGVTLSVSIGGLDSTVIRDPKTNQPYIPGSSLKGKMRSLLELSLNKDLDRNGGTHNNPIYRHECTDKECEVCRVFGATSGKSGGENIPSKIVVRDSFLTKESAKELFDLDTDVPYTEWKTENSLDRVTAAANPRQIERVPAGARFKFEIVYTAYDESHVEEDIKNILGTLKMIEDDYLGGGGSRGSGKVKFHLKLIEKRPIEYYLEGDDTKKLKQEFEGKSLEEASELISEVL